MGALANVAGDGCWCRLEGGVDSQSWHGGMGVGEGCAGKWTAQVFEQLPGVSSCKEQEATTLAGGGVSAGEDAAFLRRHHGEWMS